MVLRHVGNQRCERVADATAMDGEVFDVGQVGCDADPQELFATKLGHVIAHLQLGDRDAGASQLAQDGESTRLDLPQIASGKLRALAATSGVRVKALPDVPTMKEAGVPNLDWGMFVPAGTPAAVVQKLSSEMQVVLAMPEVISAIDKLGVESAPQNAADFAAFFRKSVADHEAVAREFKLVQE